MIEWVYCSAGFCSNKQGGRESQKSSVNYLRYRSKNYLLTACKKLWKKLREKHLKVERQGAVSGYLFKHPHEIPSLESHKKKKEARNHVSNVVTEKYTVSLLWIICFHQQVVRPIYIQRSCIILSLLWRSQLNMKGLLLISRR